MRSRDVERQLWTGSERNWLDEDSSRESFRNFCTKKTVEAIGSTGIRNGKALVIFLGKISRETRIRANRNEATFAPAKQRIRSGGVERRSRTLNETIWLAENCMRENDAKISNDDSLDSYTSRELLRARSRGRSQNPNESIRIGGVRRKDGRNARRTRSNRVRVCERSVTSIGRSGRS